MTHLDDALRTLGLPGKSELEGTWVTVEGERCQVYVMGTRWGHRYYTWCDDPRDWTVKVYPDPVAAIQAGLRRAARPETEGEAHSLHASGGDTEAVRHTGVSR